MRIHKLVLTMSGKTQKVKETKNIPIEKLVPGVFDLRSSWENGELQKSIEKDGILQPISVRPSKNHLGKYEVVDGNRRVRIATTLGIKEVPAVIYLDLGDNDALKMAIVTNVARATLNARDQGVAVKRYRALNPNKTLDTIAVELGMSPKLVRDYTYVAELNPSIKIAKAGTPASEAHKKGEVMTKTARQLARVTAKKHPDLEERHGAQKELAEAIRYLPQRQRSKIIVAYGKEPKETSISEIIKEVKKITRHVVSVELTEEMYSALNHFKLDRNLDVAKALRALILEGLRHYKYMV